MKAKKIGWLFSVVLSEYRLATNSQLPPPQPLLFTRTVSHLPAPSSRASLAWVDESPLDERENEAKCRIGASRSRYWRPSRHPAVPLAAPILILPNEKQTHETELGVTRHIRGPQSRQRESRLGSCTSVEVNLDCWRALLASAKGQMPSLWILDSYGTPADKKANVPFCLFRSCFVRKPWSLVRFSRPAHAADADDEVRQTQAARL